MAQRGGRIVNISSLSALQNATLRSNALRALDTSQNLLLEQVYAYENQLERIDLSANEATAQIADWSLSAMTRSPRVTLSTSFMTIESRFVEPPWAPRVIEPVLTVASTLLKSIARSW